MRMRFTAGVVGSLVVGLSGCNGCQVAAVDDTPGTLRGTVCQQGSGRPSIGATVNVVLPNVPFSGPESALEPTTNDMGVFQLCGIPVGNHSVIVRGTGFQKAYPAAVTEGQTVEVTSATGCTAYNPMDYCRVTG